METLKSLIQIVTQKRVKKVELFDEDSRNKSSHYYALFHGIHQEKYTSDQDAAKDIYACDASEKKYLILKTRLKQKLMNTIFFLDPEENESVSALDLIRQDCEKIIFQAKTLLLCEAGEISVALIEKNLKKAQDNHLTDIVLESAKILADYYLKKGQKTDFNNHNNMVAKYSKMLFYENEAHHQWKNIEFEYKKENTTNDILLESLKNFLNWWEDKKENLEGKLKIYYDQTSFLYSKISQKHEDVTSFFKKQFEIVQNNPEQFSKNDVLSWELEKANHLLNFKKFDDFKSVFKTEKNIEEIPLNFWIEQQEYKFMAALYQQNYAEGNAIFQETHNENRFKKISEDKKEFWYVAASILHYFHKQEKIPNSKTISSANKINFRYQLFLEYAPEYQRSKRGLHVMLMTIQILFYIERLEFTQIQKRLINLNEYCRLYPKKDGNFRSECFINMVNILEKNDFKYYPTKKATEELLTELENTPIDYRGTFRNIEVIPYEHLWSLIMEKIRSYKYV
ncbi:MAG: hypothetical protein EAZ85_13960 [Bacteroidetes bacterium]|nr:MAG: hypothetical protein EAZ85_13960 [Bacteroidota bacterium]TAG89855.1 MAG: hypothetical protein EAZ20_05630 [Bacteroidota bacterium]